MPSHFCLRWASSWSHCEARGAKAALLAGDRSAQAGDRRMTGSANARGVPKQAAASSATKRKAGRDVSCRRCASAKPGTRGQDRLRSASPKSGSPRRFPRFPELVGLTASTGSRALRRRSTGPRSRHGHRRGCVACPRSGQRRRRPAQARQRVPPGDLQPVRRARFQFGRAVVEISRYFLCDLPFIGHKEMPLALSASANARTAREQCVFTLPSEQPIAAAASATSNSSQ